MAQNTEPKDPLTLTLTERIARLERDIQAILQAARQSVTDGQATEPPSVPSLLREPPKAS